MRIPASGGVPQFVLETRNLLDFRCARAPASLCVIFETSQDRKQLVITAFDPLKGRGKVLRTIENDPSHDLRRGGDSLRMDQRLRFRELASQRFTFACFRSQVAPTAKSR